MGNKNTRDILKKMLMLVPLLHANPGIKLQELTRISGFTDTRELHRYLERLIMFGTPPFAPDNFIEIYIDDEERVYLNLPQGLERPLALTSQEWLVLKEVIAEEMRFQPSGESDRSILARIFNQLSAAPVLSDELGIQNESRRTLISEALEEGLQLEFCYRSLSSKEPEVRRVDPWAMFRHRGVDYLIANCHLRQAARYFQLERMEDIEILELPQEVARPENLAEIMQLSPIFQDKPSGFSVKLAFSPEIRSALEWHLKLTECELTADEAVRYPGWMGGECRVRESIWFRYLVRGFGKDVAIISPQHLRDSFREELEAIQIPERL